MSSTKEGNEAMDFSTMSIQRKEGIIWTIDKETRRTKVFNGFVIEADGKIIDEEKWQSMPLSDLLRTIEHLSSIIEQSPDIHFFNNGALDYDKLADGGMILGYQYGCLATALSRYILNNEFTTEELGMLLDYVYSYAEDGKVIRPFAEIVQQAINNCLSKNELLREKLYEALERRKKSLATGMATIDKLPYKGIFLLDGSPTVGELARFFIQRDGVEKNLVVDSFGRYFLVRGGNEDTAVISYRNFPDIIRDSHTHRMSYSFSSNDIVSYKSFGGQRNVYGIKAENIDFSVSCPKGLFQFFGNLNQNIFDKVDRKRDALLIPCTVKNEDSGETRSFPDYTNHPNGETGKFIQTLIEADAGKILIQFSNGDLIRYTSWEFLEKEGSFEKGVEGIMTSTHAAVQNV